jgi:hypothetical protein
MDIFIHKRLVDLRTTVLQAFWPDGLLDIGLPKLNGYDTSGGGAYSSRRFGASAFQAASADA